MHLPATSAKRSSEHHGGNVMAKRLAVSGIAARMLLGLAILVMAGQAAMAQTVTLACSSRNNGSLGPDLFVLNEAQNSVTIAFAAVQHNDGSVGPARSSGPLPATFAPAAITISTNDYGAVNTYVINRLTSTIQLTQYAGDHHVAGHAEWTCQVGKAQF
jgi:hypothetical protein